MARPQSVTGALLVMLWVAPLGAQATAGAIRGHVTDSTTHQPIVAATISFKGHGVLVQSDGSYLLAGLPPGTDTLRARIIGYEPRSSVVTVAAGDTLTADFALTQRAANLAQVVVVGYGSERAGNLATAVNQVTTKEFNTGRIVTPQQLIQAKVPGVEVVDNNAPGGTLTVRIRGATSVNASSDPLFVIDGMPVGSGSGGGLSGGGRDPLNFLNPDDIESITVLKDAASAAIYGANAANGVIFITTKTGHGAPRFEYSGSFSSSSVRRLPSMLDAAQFRAAVQQYAPQNAGQLLNDNTNWFDQIDHTAFGQQHDITVSGSGQTNSYRVSAGYLKQDGVIRGTSTERESLGFAYDQRLLDDHLRLRTNLQAARSFDQIPPGNLLSNAAQMGPTQPIMDPTTTTGYYDWPGNTIQSATNPVEVLNMATDQSTTYRSIGNLRAEYALPFLDALKANVNLGYDVTNVTMETFNPSTLHSETQSGENGSEYRSDPSELNSVLETFLNYSAPLNLVPGTIDLTGGYSWTQSHGEYPSFTGTGLTTNLLGTNGFATAQNTTPLLTVQENRLISFFGRLNYNLGDKYLLALSVRRDGSSRFGLGNQWGTFPSVALAWRLSNESFMQNVGWLSDLKLRGSWGKTGNQAFANYQQYASYLVGGPQAQVQFGNTFVNTIRPSAFDPNIRWEQTGSYDAGIDWGILSQRLTGSIDWYTKNTDNLIFTVPAAAGTNLSNFVTTNIGSMKNTGVEFGLSAKVFEPEHHMVGYTADFTAAHNTNELTKINPLAGAGQQILTGLVAGGVGTYIQVLEPGQPINSFYVYKQKYVNGKPVEGSYVDLNGDGVINVDDRRPFHDPAPKWILGHTSYLTYNKFDLSFTLRAYLGNYVYNNVASNLGDYQELARSSPYNLSTSVLQTGFMTPQYLSDYYVENASFLRMDNITLGYQFLYQDRPLRIYVAMQNAFTITGYSGVDPTAGINGLDNNIYPRSRTITTGLSVQF
ncbi:MAG TPA: SusC/RagA family TonB-linked outer membrane protein [Gemmatimonadaceae bacterium]|nr:SusC/RagA family TonB-linked outer membrane protein [Gemmatimonadaceae bacterium]